MVRLFEQDMHQNKMTFNLCIIYTAQKQDVIRDKLFLNSLVKEQRTFSTKCLQFRCDKSKL